MAAPLTADQMLAALRSEGCKVVEYKDWRTHNRGSRGTGWGPVNGVMIHHTVTSGDMASVRICYDGYAGLPGPLCHSVGGKDGTIYMVGHGRANHAGLGDKDVLDSVVAESALAADNESNTDGNSRFYGIELVNLGDGKDPWPDAQVEAGVRWATALCRAHGWSERSVIGHKEWQPGKIDPSFDMESFRRRVASRLNPEEETMKLSEEDLMKIFEIVWKKDALKAPDNDPGNTSWMPYSFIRDNNIRLRKIEEQLAELKTSPDFVVSAVREALEKIKMELRVTE